MMHEDMDVTERILLVEDDDNIRKTTRFALEDQGYVVAEAPTAEAALKSFSAQGADCVLLDVMLPGIDGLDCCRLIRRSSDVPIVMLTARSDSEDVVAGLEAGADDYVAKPFVIEELTARIRALIRRISGHRAFRKLTIGDLEISPEEGTVRRAGEEIALSKTEFKLLCELAASPGRVFSREDLLRTVWGYEYIGDGRIVDVHVRRLRTRIEVDPSEPRYVLTARGLGYKAAPEA